MTRSPRRGAVLACAVAGALLGGCAVPGARTDEAAAPDVQAASCSPEVERLRAQLAAEVAERQRLARLAARREETLRRQLEAMKSIERGILEREERFRTEMR